MEQSNNIKEQLPTIYRCAITLEPTEVYLEWARNCPGANAKDLTMEEIQKEATVYLIPEIEDDKPDKWLHRNYKTLFINELNVWYTDETTWPKDLSYDNFQEFFKIKFSSMVMDFGKSRIAIDKE